MEALHSHTTCYACSYGDKVTDKGLITDKAAEDKQSTFFLSKEGCPWEDNNGNLVRMQRLEISGFFCRMPGDLV